MTKKVKSFTLAELLIVLIITAIVIGLAFSILRLVQQQIHFIQKNYEKASQLALFEQRLWLDFNDFNQLHYSNNKLTCISAMDTITYQLTNDYVIRNTDTIKIKTKVEKTFYETIEIKQGNIDAIAITAFEELPNCNFFIFKKNDLTNLMNQQDGISIK